MQGWELGKEGWFGSLSFSMMTENQDFLINIIIIIIIIEKRNPSTGRGMSLLLSFRFDSWHWL